MKIRNLALPILTLASSLAFAVGGQAPLNQDVLNDLNSLCKTGKIATFDDMSKAINARLNNNMQGDMGASAPQDYFIMSNGQGRYMSVTYFDDGMGGYDNSSNVLSASGNGFNVYAVNKDGKVENFQTTVRNFQYNVGGDSDKSQTICRVALVDETKPEDQLAAEIRDIDNHRYIFRSTKLQSEAQAALESLVATGKIQLKNQDLDLLKRMLFTDYKEADKDATIKWARRYSDIFLTDKGGKKSLAGLQEEYAIYSKTDVKWAAEVAKTYKQFSADYANLLAGIPTNDFKAMDDATKILGQAVLGSRVINTAHANLVVNDTEGYNAKVEGGQIVPIYQELGHSLKVDAILNHSDNRLK